MSKPMHSCEEAARLSSRAMDTPLAPADRLLLRLHLAMCARCTSFTRQLDFLRRTSRKLPETFEKDSE